MPVSDLTDKELETLHRDADHFPSSPCTLSEILPLVVEIKRHRAAVAADRERVRTVVVKAVVDVLQEHEPCEAPDVYDAATMRIGEWIASRAADQLATAAGLSAEDLRVLKDLADSWTRTTLAERETLDRLIARGVR